MKKEWLATAPDTYSIHKPPKEEEGTAINAKEEEGDVSSATDYEPSLSLSLSLSSALGMAGCLGAPVLYCARDLRRLCSVAAT